MQAAQCSMAEVQQATAPPWLGRSRWTLLCDVTVGCDLAVDRLWQLTALLVGYFRPGVVRARLERLRSLGHIVAVPSTAQILVAGRDQMMLGASEETKIFYRSQRIPWYFHNLRRFLADPATMLDPVGLFAPREAIVRHVLQTFHRHPVYDWVLLRGFEQGIEEMQRQIEQIQAGTHPHQRALLSLVEDGSYHARLRKDLEAFLVDPLIAARPIPAGLVDDPYLMLAMDQFKDLRGFTDYASRLSATPVTAVMAWLQVGWNESLGSLLRVKLGPNRVKVECCDTHIVACYLTSPPTVRVPQQQTNPNPPQGA
jgi:hypothetical protein